MNGAWHLLTSAWPPPSTHSVTPNSPTFLTLHQITSHYTSHHTVSLDPDIILHHVASHNAFANYADMPVPYWTASPADTTWGGGSIAPSRDCSHLASMASQGAHSNWCPSQQSTVLLPSDCSEHCIHIHSRLVTTAASLLCTISAALSAPCVCYFSARSNVPWHIVLRVHPLYNTHVPMLISAISRVFLLSFATHIYAALIILLNDLTLFSLSIFEQQWCAIAMKLTVFVVVDHKICMMGICNLVM